MSETEGFATLVEALKMSFSEGLKGVHTLLPGEIVSYDNATQRARVRIGCSIELIDNTLLPYPVLIDVPVQFPRWGGYTITMPVSPGDECAVVFGERDMSRFLSSGATDFPPVTARKFDLSDGFAIMGLSSSASVVSDAPTDAIEIRADTGLRARFSSLGTVAFENAGEELISLLSEILQQLSTETVTVAGVPTPLNGAALYTALKLRLDTFKELPP
jgi:hypothetical protein